MLVGLVILLKKDFKNDGAFSIRKLNPRISRRLQSIEKHGFSEEQKSVRSLWNPAVMRP